MLASGVAKRICKGAKEILASAMLARRDEAALKAESVAADTPRLAASKSVESAAQD